MNALSTPYRNPCTEIRDRSHLHAA